MINAFPALTDEDAQALLPKKESVTAVKVIAHNGQQCKLFCTAKVPMFFQADYPEPRFFPTIYTLWRYPHLLYSFTTNRAVIPNLAKGAALMLPGVILPGPATLYSFGKMQKGTSVCVNTEDNEVLIHNFQVVI